MSLNRPNSKSGLEIQYICLRARLLLNSFCLALEKLDHITTCRTFSNPSSFTTNCGLARALRTTCRNNCRFGCHDFSTRPWSQHVLTSEKSDSCIPSIYCTVAAACGLWSLLWLIHWKSWKMKENLLKNVPLRSKDVEPGVWFSSKNCAVIPGKSF